MYNDDLMKTVIESQQWPEATIEKKDVAVCPSNGRIEYSDNIT